MKKVAILFVVLLTSSFLFAQKTYVPDDKFEQALIDLGYDTTLDDSVLTANISGVTELDVNEKEISDLTGIEGFTALTHLGCYNNKLTSLDVSKNTALQNLQCFDNQLTTLDLSKNTALVSLSSGGNKLTALDVSSNTALTHLDPSNNQLTSLDVSSNTALTFLECSGNQLTSLDVSSNTALEVLSLDDNQLTSLDVTNNSALIDVVISHNQMTSFNVTSNTALTKLTSYANKLTSLDVTKNIALTRLVIDGAELTTAGLDISNNTALTSLGCAGSHLSSLDVSANTSLITIYAPYNQLTSLDVSKNTALQHLTLHDNQLTSLDVSNNTALDYLHCYNNQLTSLDVSANTTLTNLKCSNNKLTSLDVSSNTALTRLECSWNQITNLDVSNNTALIDLRVNQNKLTSLDVSKNIALTHLYCTNNQLTSLDVSKNTALIELACYSSQLISLNMRNGVTDLFSFFNAKNNPLTCIETLDPAYATTNWTSANGNIDAGVTFAVICGGTDLTTWHVATTGSDGSGSGTETSPLATIQTGINAASSGDTVSVAAGTYKENIDFEDKNIVVQSSVGFENTIIDGDNKGATVTMKEGVISGFTIMNGLGGAVIGDRNSSINSSLLKKNSYSDSYLIKAGKIENVVIVNNTSRGIFKLFTDGLINHVTMTNNHSTTDFLISIDYSGGVIKNSIIWGNTRVGTVGTIFTEDINAYKTISHSIIQGPTQYNYMGTGVMDVNPKFVKVVKTGDEESDYHLKDSSPAIGAGTATGAPTADIEGNPRPNPAGSNPDMGAFENKWGTPQNATPVITAMSDVTVNEDESYSDTLRATDEEGDAITYSATSDTSAVTASITDSILTLTPNANWHGVANIKAYASDGTSKDSTSFKLTVTPVQDAPSAFEWVSGALDTINITQSNLADTYTIQWDASTDVDGDSINYLIYAKIGLYPTEEVEEITDTTFQLIYEEILENVFEGRPVNGATVSLNVKATDGIDTVDVTGENRVIYVNRYEYLSTEGEGIPTEFALHENYPNPFNPSTTLRFDLPEVSDITLTIYNMLGQKVRTFNYQNTSAGYHSVKWNATNDYGDPVGAGVYLYQLQTKDFVKTRKMVLLK